MNISEQQPLTARQQAVYEFIREQLHATRRPPTVREIADHFGFRSPKGGTDHLAALERKGWIIRTPGVSRGIQLVEDEMTEEEGIPILGKVAAGHPILAQQNLMGSLSFSQLFGLQDRFAVQVMGESMIEAGIHEGDFVVVQRTTEFRDGDIVVAMIEGEATVKRFERDKQGRILLCPENPRFEPIVVDEQTSDFRMAGLVVGVVRKYG